MKKLTSFKKIGLKSTAMLLCLATSATAMTLAIPAMRGAFADESETATPAIPESGLIAEDVELAQTCNYGESFKVPGNAKVTAPNGSNAEVKNGEVVATQVGNYKVTYGEGLTYDFYVRVRMKEDYFLKVDYDGADIPSYIATNKTFTLPEAQVVYYDENNILREYPTSQYSVTAKDSRGTEYSFAENGNKTFNAGATTGKVFITYDAVVNGDGAQGTKHFSKTFTVNVQAQVNRSGNPTLSVSGVQRDVSVNRAVTLPKAEATDSYDDNVKVVIKVTDPNGNDVRTVDINEDGYAYRDATKEANGEYNKVKFDNDRAMTFYPIETGTYKVSYTAYNDAYNEDSNTGKSSTREYYITVSDLAAPVFKNIDDSMIPETWGMTVNGAENGIIKFPIPEVVDNKDHMPNGTDGDKDLISVYFRITDADNSQNIVTFENILADDDKSEFKYNDVYQKLDDTADTVKFGKDGFEFNFKRYAKKNRAGEEQDLPGEYTVLYRAKDSANNTSSRTFTINLQENYTDEAAPTTAEVTVPEYISGADKTFTVPNPVYADASDTRLTKDYRIYNDKGAVINVKGGEVADIVEDKDSNTRKLVIEKDKELELGDKLYFYVAATDDAGNFKSNCGDSINLDEDATKYTECKAIVNIVPSGTKEFTYNAKIALPEGELTVGNTVNLGGFTIETTEEMRDYTGFEVAAYGPNGNNINVTLQTTSTVKDGRATIIVQNIEFNLATATVAKEGEENEAPKYYSLIVRVFDVNGVSDIYGYVIKNVKSTNDGTTNTSAITEIGTTGSANVSYKLKNAVIEEIPGTQDDTFRVMRKISGGAFSVMGSEFIAKTQSSYSFADGYVNDNDINDGTFTYDVKNIVDTYNVTLTDMVSPVIEVQGVMPTYKDFTDPKNKSVTVDLPKIVAYTENGFAEVKIEVKGPKNKGKVDVEEYTDGDNAGKKYFTATADGAYVVTVTATYKNAHDVSATYTINVGDIQGPEFKLSGGSDTTVPYTVGDTFKFQAMELKETENGVTITKQIINPSNETVSEATVDGSYTNNKDRENNGTEITLDMAGTYKVVYIARDANLNETRQEFEITVVSSGTSTPTTWTTLSTVLIVIAIVLLAGVIVYVVRFRKVKK